MALPVSEIQNRISAEIDTVATQPTVGGSEWLMRLSYINRRQQAWAETYDWSTLYKEYNCNSSTGSANASISLPGDFRKIAGYPKVSKIGGYSDDEVPLIDPKEKGRFSTSDKYAWIAGNPMEGYSMVINLAMATLSSGTSISVPYYATPSALATTTHVSSCPDPEYLIQGVVADLYRVNEDSRFPLASAEADRILARMIENEEAKTTGYNDSVGIVYETKHSFRWGKNQ